MKKGSDKQSKKDWEDEFDEMESIYKFPYPENLGDAKSDPSDSLSIILTTPITMHKNIAKSRKTYSRLATRPMIGLGEQEKFVIDTQLKRKSPLEPKSSTNNKKSKKTQKLPKTEDPVDEGNLNIGSETHDLFTRNLSEGKSGKISVEAQSNTGYHRTRKNLKRKLEEEKKISNNYSTDTLLRIQNITDSKLPEKEVNLAENSKESTNDLMLEEEKEISTNDSTDTLQLPIQNITDSTLPEEVVNVAENSEESSNDLNLNFQPPPPAQKLSLMDLVQKYSQSIDPSQPEEVTKKSKKPVKNTKQGKKTCTVSKKASIEKKVLGQKYSSSVVNQKSNNSTQSNEELPEAAKSSLVSKYFPAESQAIVGNNGISNSISCDQKIISHMNMRESLIKACKGKISNSKDSAMLSTDEKSMNLNLINIGCNNSLNGKNTQSNTARSNSSCVSSSTVVKRIVSVKSVISREKTCGTVLEPDFQIQHRTSYLQSADFFCAFMSEIDAKKNEIVSETVNEAGVTNDISVRQFCSSPNVNDAFSEILSGCTDVDDCSPPNICYEFPDNFLDKPFQLLLTDYVDWILDIMIPRKNNLNNSYFSSKYILDFSYKHMSYQECAIMSMVFNDPKEHLLLPSIAAKLSFVGMVIIFNAYLKETCNPR